MQSVKVFDVSTGLPRQIYVIVASAHRRDTIHLAYLVTIILEFHIRHILTKAPGNVLPDALPLSSSYVVETIGDHRHITLVPLFGLCENVSKKTYRTFPKRYYNLLSTLKK